MVNTGFSMFRGLILALVLLPALATGAEARLAVAANFFTTTQALADRFRQTTDHSVVISYGSTGKLYAQIRQGAPFDVFMAADQWRPERLEALGLTEPGSRFTYAIGRLALWSPDPDAFSDPEAFLVGSFQRPLAIANPATAPYGLAAQQALTKLGLWEQLEAGLVRGESIAQTFQFIATGNARGGFIALTQLLTENREGSVWRVPGDLHEPIIQQVTLLERGRDNPAALAWMTFLKSPEARAIIRSHGYDLTESL
jgi:molybdate transport system substrate-binding protein